MQLEVRTVDRRWAMTPEFKVVPSWNAPNYDERFNGLGEDIHIRIICEQDVGE